LLRANLNEPCNASLRLPNSVRQNITVDYWAFK
jgi:hypothetical protein